LFETFGQWATSVFGGGCCTTPSPAEHGKADATVASETPASLWHSRADSESADESRDKTDSARSSINDKRS
jgi:hypothetical protein